MFLELAAHDQTQQWQVQQVRQVQLEKPQREKKVGKTAGQKGSFFEITKKDLWQEQPFGIRNSSTTPISQGRYRKKSGCEEGRSGDRGFTGRLVLVVFEPALHTAQKTPDEDERVLVPGAWAPPVLYDDAEAEFR